MSLVHSETGELVALCTPEEARVITDRIKVAVEAAWELIVQAYQSRAWAALGYSSWDDYCTREFGTARIRLPREERPEVVASLREAGLSTRAIAAATGTDQRTVRRDLEAGEANAAPEENDESEDAVEAETVTGTDGKTYSSSNGTDPRHQQMLERRERVKTLHAEGLSVVEIARKLDVHNSTISADFDALGLTRSRDLSRTGTLKRRKRLCQLAAEGHTSRQIADELGIAEGTVRNIARELDVEIIADRHVGGSRRHDSTRIVEAIVMAAENATAGVDLINFEELDPTHLDGWASSLEHAIWSLRKFKKQLVQELTP